MTGARILVCALLLLARFAHAAEEVESPRATKPPTRIPLTGVLESITGEPREGEVTLVLSIYADRDSAEALWVEEQTVSLGKDGRYDLALGGTSEEGLASELFSANGARWIGIAEKGQLEQPRFMLVSVPYATKALDADAVGGRTAKDFVLASELDEKVASVLAGGQTDATWHAPARNPRPATGVRSFAPNLIPRSHLDASVPAAGRFTNEAPSGVMYGVHAQVHSTSGGSVDEATSAVYGEVTPTSPGSYSAGVRGINRGTAGLGIGVVGMQAGSGWGVFGNTPAGVGVYGLSTTGVGVAGTSAGPGAGVFASHSGDVTTGPGLQVQGGIKVSGTHRAAFVHTATEGGGYTVIDHPLANGQPNAILFVTQRATTVAGPSGPIHVCCGAPEYGVGYNESIAKWLLITPDGAAIASGTQFNVLVVSQ